MLASSNEPGTHEVVVRALVDGAPEAVKVPLAFDVYAPDLSLTVAANNASADGAATNSVKALVQDATGNPLLGQTVSFTANNGATVAATAVTDASGEATVTLTNTKAGITTVTATVGTSSKTADVTFVANAATAKVARLIVVANNGLANGALSDSVRAV